MNAEFGISEPLSRLYSDCIKFESVREADTEIPNSELRIPNLIAALYSLENQHAI